jgi:UDP-2,3-diacylglucosamine pyrophosphatase LpxH
MIHQLLTSALRKALQLKLNGETKYILFSDIHKGDNSYADDFKHNIKIYKEALHHYYINDYTYIELGDGLELWENKKIKPIIKAHQVIFDLLKEFHHKNRLYLIYGNHDMTMMYQFRVRKLLGSIFTNLKYHESILLDTGKPKHNLLLLHGHQADYMNYLFWWFHRFLVRYVWKPLQLLGINDPTSPAKNYKSLIKVERRMKDWILKNNNQPVIFGHTHRPRFPKPQDIPMFNTGSCVHPESIIGIEIVNMQISMVQWLDNEDSQKTVKVILEGPIDLNLFWK